ncbi:hypothetical protein Xbed_03514 [Xenorhabdus beddingii]|uniref:Phage protein n=1 Tax=Xenorhabdus beddingii TaxID=40578 RepID=A0A1Y2SBF9_9GAMM|nr:hypothetical protein [Xenorhabdus beddingii]OTA16042.1 hypothetical protein Xbed_03514 [Xenorhabdus beddingii]
MNEFTLQITLKFDDNADFTLSTERIVSAEPETIYLRTLTNQFQKLVQEDLQSKAEMAQHIAYLVNKTANCYCDEE